MHKKIILALMVFLTLLLFGSCKEKPEPQNDAPPMSEYMNTLNDALDYALGEIDAIEASKDRNEKALEEMGIPLD